MVWSLQTDVRSSGIVSSAEGNGVLYLLSVSSFLLCSENDSRVLWIKTARDVDSWNSRYVLLSAENTVPLLGRYFSLKPGQDV